ncbi:MAG: TetR/AcrR family transcriptional regulator [Ardenticatenaceae bacterium]|nr:TetR/AcrR family transcriptional regulator [Ardenticatenaceae bacterium]
MSDTISLGSIGNEKRTERRDAAENRALILETAESLFNQHGVTNVNMADIAQAAGVGKGTLYRRFANKAELCLALMDTQMLDFQNAILGRMRQMAANGVSAVEQLDQFLDALVYFTDTHSPLLCEVQREGLLGDFAEEHQRPHFWQHMTVSGLLQTAVTNGELPSTLDIAYTSDALLAPLHANIFRFQRQGRGFSLERISAGLRALVHALQHLEEEA